MSSVFVSFYQLHILTILKQFYNLYCTARQCSSLRRIFIECCIINPALWLLMKHLVIGQRQRAPNFSAFHWSPHGSLVTEKDRNKLNY